MLNDVQFIERPTNPDGRSSGGLRTSEDVVDSASGEATILRILDLERVGRPRALFGIVALGATVLLAASVFQLAGFESGDEMESYQPNQVASPSAPSFVGWANDAFDDLGRTEESRPVSTEEPLPVSAEEPHPAFSPERLHPSPAQAHGTNVGNIAEPGTAVLASGPEDLSVAENSASVLPVPAVEHAPAAVVNSAPAEQATLAPAPVRTQAVRASAPAEPARSESSPPAAAIVTAARRRSGTIGRNDYPPSALRALAQGSVAVRYTVGANGRASECTIISSSGRSDLDSTTCRLVQERFRFEPAKNAAGQAVPQTVTRSHEWYLRVRR